MRFNPDEASASLPAAFVLALVVTSLVGIVACGPKEAVPSPVDTTLRMGFGSTNGENSQAGLRQQLRVMEREPLLAYGKDGRPQAALAESWMSKDEGLKLRVRLRPGVEFHDGTVLTAATVARFLEKQLPGYLGPAYDDVAEIRAVSDLELDFVLKRRSNFLLEALDILVEQPDSHAGTGAFSLTSGPSSAPELRRFDKYYRGPSYIDRIVITQYPSVRSAWADMLRGQLDMLYEVGGDAFDSLEASDSVRLFTYQRTYVYVGILNVHRPGLTDAETRRRLNAAIDRPALIKTFLSGRGRPAEGPVWPDHWANDPQQHGFTYQPVALANPLELTCLVEPSVERLAVVMQQQLLAIGVHLKLESTPLDKIYQRIQSGDFDVVLADATAGPTMLRPSWFWHSKGPFNWGHYENKSVDAALDSIRHAPDDATYKAGVAAFQRAIVDDPPAIFLAWGERARAVSTRFEVPVEPGRDVLSTLRLWRPLSDPRTRSPN